MHKKKNHITNSEDYRRYLDGSMTSRERHAFEKRMLEDDFEDEALDGFLEINPDDLSHDLDLLANKLKNRSRKRSYGHWSIAATILILAVSSFAVYFLLDTKTSSEIAQTKEKPPKEKPLISNERKKVLGDSIAEETEPMIAYKQEFEEVKKVVRPPEVSENMVIEVETDDDMNLAEVDDEYEMEEEKAEFQKAEQKGLLTIAYDEEEPSERGRSAIAKKAKPQTEIKQNGYSARIDNIRTVTGKIVSVEDNTPVPGVNVVVKGTDHGTVADLDGYYEIDVPEEAILVFSYIGLASKEIQVKEEEIINIAMELDDKQLTEVVIVTKKTRDKTYADSPPRPEAGQRTWNEYIKTSLRYPTSGLEKSIKGIVKLNFIVSFDGKLSNFEVLKSLGDDFDKEAIRLVKKGPNWVPATENGYAVNSAVTIKIRFRPPK